MTAIRQCECCSGDGSEGKKWFIGAEGEDICARCAAELLGAERDALRQQLRGAVEENKRLRSEIMLARDRLDAFPISPRLIIARDGLDRALDGGQ